MKKNNKNLVLKIALSLLYTVAIYANRGEEVYQKVCAKCHEAYIPADKLTKNFLEDNNTLLHLKAPPINQISYSMKEKIGDPNADEDIRRMEVSAFIADYIIYPDKQKSVLPPYVKKYFATMPSLKGKLSTEDIEAISSYVYDYDKKINDEKSIHYESFDNAYEKAKKENKIILIKATAPHCRYCTKMNREVLLDTDVVKALKKDFIVVSVDVSKESLPMGFHVSMTPSFFFVFPQENKDKVKTKRIPGAWNKEDFLEILKESVMAKNHIKK
jgi:thioredoxin-related protein/cytochrome c553